jgi:tRNA-dihydrouridine synthase
MARTPVERRSHVETATTASAAVKVPVTLKMRIGSF